MCMYVCLSVCLPVCLSVCLCLSVCVYVCIYIPAALTLSTGSEWKLAKGKTEQYAGYLWSKAFRRNWILNRSAPLHWKYRDWVIFLRRRSLVNYILDEFYSNPQKKRKRKVAQFSTIFSFGFDFSIFSNCFLVYRSDSSDLLGPLGPPLPGEAAAAWATWSCHSLAISLQQASSWGQQGIPTRQWGLMIINSGVKNGWEWLRMVKNVNCDGYNL